MAKELVWTCVFQHTIELASGRYQMDCVKGCVVCRFPLLERPKTNADRMNLVQWLYAINPLALPVGQGTPGQAAKP